MAELHVNGHDMPSVSAHVVPLPGFDRLAPLFAEELRRLNELEDVETPEWAAAYDAIRRETRLRDPAGRDVPEYLLHIDGLEAWWRWHHEPFDD